MKRQRVLANVLALTGFMIGRASAADVVVSVTANHDDGRYALGEPITFVVHPSLSLTGAKYTLLSGARTVVRQGELDFRNGDANVTTSLDQPGTVLLSVETTDADGSPIRALAGAIAAPEQIKPSAPRPSDFDAFWQSKIDELHAVPMNALLGQPATTRPAVESSTFEYSHVTLDNIRGTHIQGQLSRPKQGDHFPALLIVQWAGVYPLDPVWVTGRAEEGWLALNINAHNLPIDQPAKFYADQFAGPLKEYWAIGNDDREASYFLRMYLSCYRAADYLASRPDWDGKTLVVIGGSQGGLQALMTAALHPKVTAALANVPAGCDMLGPDVGRKAGWPQWIDFVRGKDVGHVREASRYYDVVNFASRIHCPTLIGAGLIDETCPAPGIVAAFNQIAAPKELVLLPQAAHQETNNSHGAYTRRCWSDWLPALRQGLPAPVAH